MKKILLPALLSVTLFASQNSDYVGIGGGNSWFAVDKPTEKVTNDGLHGTFTLGHKYEDYGRFYVSGTYLNSSDAVSSSGVYSVAYDAMFPIVDDMLSFYVGPVVGYTTYTEGNLDLSGLHYGGETGLTLSFGDTFEIEGGYRFLKETGESLTTKARDMQMAYLQVNFYFKY